MTKDSEPQTFDDSRAVGCEPKTAWFESLRPFNFVATLRERSKARRLCAAVLTLYRQIATELPQSLPGERYSLVMARYSGAAPGVVIRGMRLAAESFASWPAERELTLRDIAQYLALTDGLKNDIAVSGVRSHAVDCMINTVASQIPADL